MLKEFKEFALKGNVMDMAVGIIIGAAFTTIVNSLVNDVIMPPLGVLIGNLDFSDFYILLKDGKVPGPYYTVASAKAAGAVTISYGIFLNHVVNFLIVTAAIFITVKNLNRLKRVSEPVAVPPPDTRECPFCLSKVPLKATVCAFCTNRMDG